MAKKVITVYVGRFQPLHKGHEHILRHALSTSNVVVVLVGSSFQARTIKNPFTFDERREMLEKWHLGVNYDAGFTVLPLRDQPYNNAKWIQSVQEQVDRVINDLNWASDEVEVRLTGSNRDASTWYLSAFPQYKNDLLPAISSGKDLSATKLRHRLFAEGVLEYAPYWNDVPPSTFAFLERFMNTREYSSLKAEYDFIEQYKEGWKVAPYEPTFVTVDAVVVQSGHVLVVRRGALPGKGLWALPGGFLDKCETLKEAVIRELVEETGIKVPVQILSGSIRAHEIFDHPDRSLRGRTITTAFLIRLDDTKPLPKVRGQNAPLHETGGKAVVETEKAFWLPINDARAMSDRWFEDHGHILDVMIGLAKD